MSTTLYIKDMVCVRCKMAVEAVFKSASIDYVSIVLGRAQVVQELTPLQKANMEAGLKYYGLELMQDKTEILVEQIKTEIRALLQTGEPMTLKLSAHLSKALDYNYNYLANKFSECVGMTLERYFISQRVEKAKELIIYEGLSLTDIADALAYSSVSHLCVQFKKVAGLTPAEFKKLCQSDNFVWREL